MENEAYPFVDAKQSLINILRAKSFRRAPEGEMFTLASGKQSSYFVDVKMTAMDPSGIFLLGGMLVDALWAWQLKSQGLFLNAVAGVALGGCPLATAASLYGHIKGFIYPTLYVRKEPKNHGTAKLVEGPVVADSRVALLEDVATTGGSSLKAIEALRAAGVQVPLVIAVVDREEGAADAFKEAGVDFVSLVKVSEL